VIVDLEAESRERTQKIEDALRTSGLVTRARVMGFQENIIKLALKRLVGKQFIKNCQNTFLFLVYTKARTNSMNNTFITHNRS